MIADTILYNLRGAGKDGRAVELIGIDKGTIVFLGPRGAMNDLSGPGTMLLDCQGGFVVPGFNDAHCHPLGYATTLRQVDCSFPKVRSIADLQAVLRDRAKAPASDRWLRAANYQAGALDERRPPSRWEIDAAVPDRPVILVERSGQHCVLNSVAMRECGIDDELSDGLVPAHDSMIAERIPPLGVADFESVLRQANTDYLSHGLTSLQDTSWSNGYRHWCAMRSFRERGLLHPRLTLLPGVDALAEFKERRLATGSGDDRLRLGAAKIALDESRGGGYPDQQELDLAALTAHRAGFGLAFHASDSQLLQMSLKALAAVRAKAGTPVVRPRLEHAPICPPSLHSAIAESGAVVVTQPYLMFLAEYAGRTDPTSFFPFRSLLAHGIPLAFSSDSPLVPCSPFQVIAAAVTRAVPGGEPLGVTERISVADAFRLYSLGGAYASGQEESSGTLALGRWADLAVLDCDPFAVPANDVRSLKVTMTLIGGAVVWTC